jgi:hypothetical protein
VTEVDNRDPERKEKHMYKPIIDFRVASEEDGGLEVLYRDPGTADDWKSLGTFGRIDTDDEVDLLTVIETLQSHAVKDELLKAIPGSFVLKEVTPERT